MRQGSAERLSPLSLRKKTSESLFKLKGNYLKIHIDLSQRMKWQAFFKENQTKALALQDKIKTTDAEIDDMVFGLYDLIAEEIAIVRG